MKFEKTEVWGFEHAIRGMRNPKESWSLSDSIFGICDEDEFLELIKEYPDLKPSDMILREKGRYCDVAAIGKNDMKLMRSLIKGGSEHRKFLRQIFISVDITAPVFWWKEFDTYKIGTTANSTSTMHKIASKPITVDCFEIDDYRSDLPIDISSVIGVETGSFVKVLENLRQIYLDYVAASKRPGLSDSERKHFQKLAKRYWKELIRWLPESWLQTRTVTLTYENIYSMRHQRKDHKLTEWSGKEFDEEIATPSFMKWSDSLPYAKEFFGEDNE